MVTLEGHPGQPVDVARRAEALADRLRELEILGVEVVSRVGARHHQGADAVAVRLDRAGDEALFAKPRDQPRFFGVAAEVRDRVPGHVRIEQRTADLKRGPGQPFARAERILESSGGKGSRAGRWSWSTGGMVFRTEWYEGMD